jgi:tetrameric-type glycyl-tRNA synthetase alpha subunit
MTEKHTFQSIILKLQEFWAERGCVIWQPYYTQVGAGTMNPATFLRTLGPEPWNVAYVEPSVRPDDGRYGENPNRFQMHYQFQVILKPDPGNPQELYLDSLKAIGIDPRQHDIRFVEDNWEQPAISAWGLGWEVWLDGQEITQFTYFQQVGGQTLDPVAVELTYGLDRILIALNDAAAIWDEPWAQGVLYGELRRREEFEHSKYYYEVADVERAREMYELYARECNACLEQGLVLPAHDYVLKCSHTFNILDARGAIGVTERQGYFRRMREMARRVAEAYLEQRKEVVQGQHIPQSLIPILFFWKLVSRSYLRAMWIRLYPSSVSGLQLGWLNSGLSMVKSVCMPPRVGLQFTLNPFHPASPTVKIWSRDPPPSGLSILPAWRLPPGWDSPRRMEWIPKTWKSANRTAVSMSLPSLSRKAAPRRKCWLSPCPVLWRELSLRNPCAGMTVAWRSRAPFAGWCHFLAIKSSHLNTPAFFRATSPAGCAPTIPPKSKSPLLKNISM